MAESTTPTTEGGGKMEKHLDLVSSETHPNLYTVVWRGGPGRVPNELQGVWTKRTGWCAICAYNEKQK
jgi:hypothetical protein